MWYLHTLYYHNFLVSYLIVWFITYSKTNYQILLFLYDTSVNAIEIKAENVHVSMQCRFIYVLCHVFRVILWILIYNGKHLKIFLRAYKS